LGLRLNKSPIEGLVTFTVLTNRNRLFPGSFATRSGYEFTSQPLWA
jgi:hypothetical protein